MTNEEINALLDALIENFREFVAEEVQRYYNDGRTISSKEILDLLRAFEVNEMTQLFNSEAIQQDQFRIFIQRYLRLWFDLLSSKINDTNEKLMEIDGKVIEVDSVDDLPFKDGDGNYNSLFAVVKGENGEKAKPYYFDSEANEWREIGIDIPEYSDFGQLPANGEGGNIGIVNGDLYYWDGNEWTKIATEDDLKDAIDEINRTIEDLTNILAQNLANSGNKARTYHDTVLEIVSEMPEMSNGDRYLLNAGEGEIVNELKVLQAGITKEYNGYSKLFVFSDNSALWGGDESNGKLIFSQNNKTYPVSGFVGKVSEMKYFNGNIYFVGNDVLYRFDRDTKSATEIAVMLENREFKKLATVNIAQSSYSANNMIYHNDKIYFLTKNKGVSYLDADGKIKATNQTTGYFKGMAVGQNGKLYLYGSNDMGVYRMEDNGGIIKLNNLNIGFCYAAMGQDNKLYFCSYSNDGIWRLEDNGSIVMVSTALNGKSFSHAAMGQDGKLYFCPDNSYSGGIWRLENNGTIVNSNKTDGVFSFAAIGQDGKLYFFGNKYYDTGVWRLEDNGTIVQTNKTPEDFYYAAMGQDNKLYICGENGIWYLDNDGLIKQKEVLEGVCYSAAMGQDGKLYFAGKNKANSQNKAFVWYLDNDGQIKELNLNIISNMSSVGADVVSINGKLYLQEKLGTNIYVLEDTQQSVHALNGLHEFENKLFFNSGTGNTVKFSYINSSGDFTEGSTINLNVEAANFDHVSAVYNGKLHIFGLNTGLYVIDSGSVTPEIVAGTMFDEPNVKYNTALTFNNLLYVGIESVSYNKSRAIVSWDGNTANPCINVSEITFNPNVIYFKEDDGSLFAISKRHGDGNHIWKLTAGVFEPITAIDDFRLAEVWKGKVYFSQEQHITTIDLSSDVFSADSLFFTNEHNPFVQDGRMFFIELEFDENYGFTGKYEIQELIIDTVTGGGGIKIVGRDEDYNLYEEPFEEGHRVVVQDSPTGFSREYGIRDNELIDTDGEDNVQPDWNQTDNTKDDYIKNKPTIPPDLSAEVAALQSVTVIRGNVDTHDHLLAIDTTNMRVNDSYIVEADENHNNNSTIYTWDGTSWNFTHLWDIQIGNLNTSNNTAQTPNSSESFSGTINLHKIAKTGSYSDLRDKPTIPAAQVNADWNATTGAAQILNKPTIPAPGDGNVQSDWNQTDNTADDFIKNKPNSFVKYGTYDVTVFSFTFDAFATKNNNAEAFDVLDVYLSAGSGNYNITITNASGNLGETRMMIFNVAAGRTANITLGFAHKLVDGGDLTLTEGVHVISLLRAAVNIVNIAPYE
jgi:hypothetical protein